MLEPDFADYARQVISAMKLFFDYTGSMWESRCIRHGFAEKEKRTEVFDF
jgi:hypothetical protein